MYDFGVDGIDLVQLKLWFLRTGDVLTLLFDRIGLSDPYQSAFLYAAAETTNCVLSAVLVDRVGAKSVLVGSMCLATAVTLFALFSQDDSPGMIISLACALKCDVPSQVGTHWTYYQLASGIDTNEWYGYIKGAVGRLGSVIASQIVNGYLVGLRPNCCCLLNCWISVHVYDISVCIFELGRNGSNI
jgi:nitrate/nitrite transporter NarK